MLHFQMNEYHSSRRRYYSKTSAKKKENYILSHIQNRISSALKQKNDSSDYEPWSSTTWEEYLFDDLAYFSAAYDSTHKYRNVFKKDHQEVWPNLSCNNLQLKF